MPPVFAHGQLRLYLLALLAEAPRHGYEVIRLLEERFQGLYAPSAGTVYPRLAKLEAEGLVSHALDGGRKTYSITEAGHAELVDRRPELTELELEVREALAALAEDADKAAAGARHPRPEHGHTGAHTGQTQTPAGETETPAQRGGRPRIASDGGGHGPSPLVPSPLAAASPGESRQPGSALDVSARAADLGRGESPEHGVGAREFPGADAHEPGAGDRSQRTAPSGPTGSTGPTGSGEDASADADRAHPNAAGRQRPSLADELRHAKEQWKEHARKARQESQQAKRQARKEREAHAEALEEVRRIARQVQDQVRTELKITDRGPTAASGGMAQPGYGMGDLNRVTGYTTAWPPYIRPDIAAPAEPDAGDRRDGPERSAADEADPEHDLLRLLDRFRDDIRDAARDNGVTERQLGAIRRELSTAAAHVAALLGAPEQYFASDGPSQSGAAHDSGSAQGPGRSDGSGRRESPPRSGD